MRLKITSNYCSIRKVRKKFARSPYGEFEPGIDLSGTWSFAKHRKTTLDLCVHVQMRMRCISRLRLIIVDGLVFVLIKERQKTLRYWNREKVLKMSHKRWKNFEFHMKIYFKKRNFTRKNKLMKRNLDTRWAVISHSYKSKIEEFQFNFLWFIIVLLLF